MRRITDVVFGLGQLVGSLRSVVAHQGYDHPRVQRTRGTQGFGEHRDRGEHRDLEHKDFKSTGTNTKL